MKDRLKKIWARRGLRWFIILVVVAVLFWLFFGGGKNVAYETVAVSRGAVIETVTATGQIKPKAYASLRFKSSGVIAKMNFDAGDRVSSGQVLASLDAGDLIRRVTQAEADMSAAEVALDNAKQEVVDQQTRGEQSLNLLYSAAPNTFNEILNLTQQMYATFATFYDSTGHLNSAIATSILFSQKVVDADNAKSTGDTAAQLIVSKLENFPVQSTRDMIDATLVQIHAPLQQLQFSLSAVINAVAAIPTGAISATTLATYKDALATARGNINSAISKESTLASDLRDANIQNALAFNTAKANERFASANVEKSKAALEIARQSLSESYLRAPISGTIAAKNKQIGELVTSSEQVYYLLGEGGFEVISNIPEVDIGKISTGDTATVELDAYGSEFPLTATVAEIDPAETSIDSIATYRAKFTLISSDEKIRSGMTATLTIETDRRNDVLIIPQRAITNKDGKRIVRLAPTDPKQQPMEVPVQVGLRGSDGSVELISGLTEGALIIVGTK